MSWLLKPGSKSTCDKSRAEQNRIRHRVNQLRNSHERFGFSSHGSPFKGQFPVTNSVSCAGRPFPGEQIQIKASKKVAFRASKELKMAI